MRIEEIASSGEDEAWILYRHAAEGFVVFVKKTEYDPDSQYDFLGPDGIPVSRRYVYPTQEAAEIAIAKLTLRRPS